MESTYVSSDMSTIKPQLGEATNPLAGLSLQELETQWGVVESQLQQAMDMLDSLAQQKQQFLRALCQAQQLGNQQVISWLEAR